MATDNLRLDVAVFIDFENVYVSVRDKLDVNPNFEIIMDRVADLGRVVIARAYADWYRYPRVTSALYANGIEPMYVPTYYYDRDLGRTGRAIKNSVDMNLCIDAMKTLFTNPNIGKFVLATGDRDFIPLVNSIRQQGKEVIIIGVGGAASGHLAQSADEFIFYEQLLGKKPQNLQSDTPRVRMPERGRDLMDIEDIPPPPPRQRQPAAPAEPVAPPAPVIIEPLVTEPDVYDTLVQAVHLARERGYVCSFGSLKLLMKELMGGDFKESKYRDPAGRPFAKFKDFAMEAERRGKVQVFTSGAVVEVFLPGEDPYKLSQFAQDLKEEPPLSTPETPVHVDARIDGRPVTANRRRRRRRGGSQRQSVVDAFETQQDLTDEELTEIEPDYLPPDAIEEAVSGDNQDDSMFEQLLDRLEAERERQAALAALDMPIAINPEASPDELPELADIEAYGVDIDEAVVSETAPEAETLVVETAEVAVISEAPAIEPPTSETPAAEAAIPAPEAETPAVEHVRETQPAAEEAPRPFSESEVQMVVDVVGSAGRPLSFAQIHDMMRETRNTTGVTRTNEELRSLIKHAINSGILARGGKGNRITYRLASPAAETPVADGEPPAGDGNVASVEVASDATPVEPPVVESDMPVVAPAAEPEAPVETAEREAPVVEAPVAEQPVVEETPAKPRRKRSASRAPQEPAVEPAAELKAEAKPARTSRSRKSGATKAEAVSETVTPPENTATAASPRPRRRRKPAAQQPEES